MRYVIVVSGPIGVGKSSVLKELLARFPGFRLSTREALIARTGAPNERRARQDAGEKLDRDTDGAWVVEEASKVAAKVGEQGILVIDSVRIAPQLTHLRQKFGSKLVHMHLTAPDHSKRYLERPRQVREFDTYDEVRASPTEASVGELGGIADFVIDTERTPAEAAFTLAATKLGLYATGTQKLVDVIVGAQYGSEGKGNICAHLAGEYDVLVRVGGPNAGHKVASPEYKYVQLPSGTGSNPRAKILIGAGTTIWVPRILREILYWGLTPDRLVIDPQAIIIHQSDRDLESETLDVIGSTKQGVGIATARKIIGRDLKIHLGARVQLAKQVDEVKCYIRDTKAELDRAYAAGHRIMLEGTQGTDLSLHHGIYPHVTSRETTASGCLADAGIGPLRVRKVVMVTRTYPIRVGSPPAGDSGDLPCEINPKTIADRCGLPEEEIRETEVGTVSGNPRRIAEFNLERVRRSAALNGATDIALTFADYLDSKNRSANSFDELTQQTKDFIAQIETVTNEEGSAGMFGHRNSSNRRKKRPRAWGGVRWRTTIRAGSIPAETAQSLVPGGIICACSAASTCSSASFTSLGISSGNPNRLKIAPCTLSSIFLYSGTSFFSGPVTSPTKASAASCRSPASSNPLREI
jgi:adenylosuccinate synthase